MTSQTTMNDTATGIAKVSIASTLVVVVLAYFMTFVVYGLVAGGVWLWQRRSSYELLVNFFSKPARSVNFAVIIGLLLLGSANAYFEDYLPSQTAEKSVNRAIQRNRLRELTTSDRLSAELKRGQAISISEELTMSNHQHIYLGNLKGDNSGIEITLTDNDGTYWGLWPATVSRRSRMRMDAVSKATRSPISIDTNMRRVGDKSLGLFLRCQILSAETCAKRQLASISHLLPPSFLNANFEYIASYGTTMFAN